MKIRDLLLWIIFLAALIVPRYARIERPITVDELTWLTFSADFYYGLGQREFEHTYQDHHPGVTTMWAGTAAYLLEFPTYRGQGQGYMENDTFKLIDFLESHEVEIFDILVTARTLMATACVIALILSLWFLWRLIGPFPAFAAMMLIAVDPYVIGQNRLYSHEGLMSVLVLLSWLSFFHYLRAGRRWSSLLVSGIAAGLAALTKITSLGLLPLIGVFWLAAVWRERPQQDLKKHLLSSVWPLLAWAVVLAVVFIALWPAAWSDPVGRVAYMIDHTRGFGGGAGAGSYNWGAAAGRVWDYIASIWSHITLISWAGVGAYLVFAFGRKKSKLQSYMTALAGFPFLYNLIVIATIGLLVKGIQGTRYMSSVHTFLALTSGIGFALLLGWLGEQGFAKSRAWLAPAALAVVLLAQVLTFLPAAPYYYVYNQPLKFNVWWETHGAFLDQAGDYFAAKPNAEDLTVMSFSPGSIMFFHPGETLLLIPDGEWNENDVEKLSRSDYLVLDFEFRNLIRPPRIVEETNMVTPEHTIDFQGRTIVWIYRVADLPPSAFIPD